MKLYSTRDKNKTLGLKEAIIKGLASDGGLYLPYQLPNFGKEFITNLSSLSNIEIYYEVANKLLGSDISKNELHSIITDTFNFHIPLVALDSDIYSLELFHGPTMAFKDVGARFMSRLLAYFYQNESKELNVVVATSGDTGSAVAAGFYNVPGIKVYILYPKGKVSFLQEKQLTTWGKNIVAIEVNGTFDDCQTIVKQLLSDELLNSKIRLTSANSINIARLIPQSFYYFSSFAQLQLLGKPIIYAVPSGNYGNLTAGILAQKMGLPITQFVAASNVNDIIPNYLKTGDYSPQKSIQTISNAMDVGNPSNFERLESLMPNLSEFQNKIKGFAFSDSQTERAMEEVYKKYNYILDPHGAVAYLGLKSCLKNENDSIGVFLETAHPAKFKEVVEKAISNAINIPQKLQDFADKEKKSIMIDNKIEEVIEIIINT